MSRIEELKLAAEELFGGGDRKLDAIQVAKFLLAVVIELENLEAELNRVSNELGQHLN